MLGECGDFLQWAESRNNLDSSREVLREEDIHRRCKKERI